MLIDTAIITIKMKPESIVESEFLPGHIGRTASGKTGIKLIWKFSGEVRIY